MLSRFMARQSVAILSPGVTVDRGREVEDWTNPDRAVVEGCSVQPGAGERDHEHADGVVADFTVYLPPDTVVDSRARFEVPQVPGQFIQEGEPERWLMGHRLDHVRVRLRRRDD